ncbi:MAG: hypothetical protein AAF460_13515 [Pseudomonadota bacterium]
MADRLAASRGASSQWQRVTWLAEDGQFPDVASKVGLGAAWRDAFRDVFGGDWASLSGKLPLTVE